MPRNQHPATAVPAAADLEVKVTRRPWNAALHPRDSRGRFVETGGIARLWGGGLARVLRALAGDMVEVERLNLDGGPSGMKEKLRANRLTMVARPDGSAPTEDQGKVEAEDALREADKLRGDGLTSHDPGHQGVTPKANSHGDDGQPLRDDRVTVNSTLESWRGGQVKPLATGKESEQDTALRRDMAKARADRLTSAQLTPSGRHLVAQEDGEWRVYEAATGRVHETPHTSKADALAAAEAIEAVPMHKQQGWLSHTAAEMDTHARTAGAPKGPASAQPGHRHARANELKPGDLIASGNPAGDGTWWTRRVTGVQDDGQNTTLTWEGSHGGGPETFRVANGNLADNFEAVGRPYPQDVWQRDHEQHNTALGQAETAARARQDTPPVPESAAAPSWLEPGQQPQRRFQSVRDVIHHWDDGTDPSSSQQTHRDKDKETAARRASATRSEQLSADGTFMVSKDGKGKWHIHHSGSGLEVGRAAGYSTKKDALADANALEVMADSEGRRFNWDAPNLRDRMNDQTFRNVMNHAIRRDRPPVAARAVPDNGPNAVASYSSDQGAPSESVRQAGASVLGDVPAAGDRGIAGPGGVLHGDRGGSGGADRGGRAGLPGEGNTGAGRARRSGVAEHGAVQGAGEGDAGAGVRPGEGARNGGSGHAADGAAAESARGSVAFGSPEQEAIAPSWEPPADGQALVPNTVLGRVKANIAAIEVLRRLESEQRPATRDEQAVLARWSGWGATPQVFDTTPAPEFAPLQSTLRDLLSAQEYEAARHNTLNAHYTDPQMTQAVWEGLRQLGFDGGEVLEPGAGSGNFIGYAPENAHITGVELDPITAGITKALYPHAEIRAEGFEKTRVPDGMFDAAVGNVPFGDYQAGVDLRHNKGNHNIHNHFILKSLDLTRPGGLVAVITSRYTMDGSTAKAEDARMEMASKADLVGAVRLPGGAHRRTAGTDVVTDLLIFRRRDKDKEFSSGRDRKGAIKSPGDRKDTDPPMWVHSARVINLPGQDPEKADDPNEPKVYVNPYFVANRDRILGSMSVGHGMYGPGDLNVDGDRNAAPALRQVLGRIAEQAKTDGLAYRKDSTERVKPRLLEPGSDRIDGHVQAEPDGTFTQVRDGQVVPFQVPATQVAEARQLVGLRDALKALVRAENNPNANDAEVEDLRKKLNDAYQAYHGKFGALNRFEWSNRKSVDPETGQAVDKSVRKRPPMGGLLAKDPTMAVILGLDTYDDITGTSTPASIFTKRQGRNRTIADHADKPEDALVLTLEAHGHLDLGELAKVMGATPQEARKRLLAARSTDPESGDEMPLVFQDHNGPDLVPAADYLSGNVRQKLNEARAKAEADPEFEVNVRHLEDVLPPDISSGEIDAPMGASWLGKEPVEKFLQEILGSGVKVDYAGGSMWKVEASNYLRSLPAATSLWGTSDYDAVKLAEAILTNGRIQVRRHPKGSPSYVDADATQLAQDKAEELRDRFQDWLWQDPERAAQVKKAYNDAHNNLALRSYDGQRRTMPGLVEWFVPHAHQHAAVSRMVNEPAALLAHEVGAGKTAEMAMGVMELRRLGMVNKPVIVVPGHMLQQFRDEFQEIYPEAQLLAAGSDDLAGRKRRQFVARAATGDWDAVIMTQTAFESIDMQPEAQRAYMEREIASLERAMARQKAAEAQDGRSKNKTKTRMVKELENKIAKLKAKIEQKTGASKDKAGLSFEDTGIDYVVVDEAHHYKNLATNSSIPGAGIEGSNRASDLDMKLEYLRGKTKSGRVVTFATATPISNSVTEAHTMLRYLRPDLLEAAKIRDFDEFASTYGKIVMGSELAPDGSGFREVARFAAFRNMPELLRIWKTVADVKNSDDLAEYLDTPDIAGGKAKTITVAPTEAQLEYQSELEARAREVKSGTVEPTEDNMLKISSDGRKVSLDPRMVGMEEAGNKLPAAADQIAKIYEQTKDTEFPVSAKDSTPHPTRGGLQIVFMDMGTPKAPGKKKAKTGKDGAPASLEEMEQGTFPAYEELKALMVARGIPADKVRFIHDAKNDAEKARLFHDARTGKIAVLIGSTTKMGTGTNVQLRATALHHLDCPWRPADLEQRNGRIIRQGNVNPEIAIFQYVTEQSFDGFSWQTVGRKAKFIRQLMKGNLTDRTVEDIPDGVFNAEQVTALATGNPYLLEQATMKASVAILDRKYKAYMRAQEGYQSTIRSFEELQAFANARIQKWQAALGTRKDTRGDAFNAHIQGKEVTSRDEAAGLLAQQALAVLKDGQHNAYGSNVPVSLGQVGGLDVTAKYRTSFSDGTRRHVVDIEMPQVPFSRATYTEDQLSDGNLALTRLENNVNRIEGRIRSDESMLREEKATADLARERIGKPFDQEAERAAARERFNLVHALIREEGKDASSDEARKAKSEKIGALQEQLKQARMRAGETEEEADDPAAEQDGDLVPRTPAPPVITTDDKGHTKVSWPDAEAKKKRRALEKEQRAEQARLLSRRTKKGDTTALADEQVAIDPAQVNADMQSIGVEPPAAAPARAAERPQSAPRETPREDLSRLSEAQLDEELQFARDLAGSGNEEMAAEASRRAGELAAEKARRDSEPKPLDQVTIDPAQVNEDMQSIGAENLTPDAAPDVPAEPSGSTPDSKDEQQRRDYEAWQAAVARTDPPAREEAIASTAKYAQMNADGLQPGDRIQMQLRAQMWPLGALEVVRTRRGVNHKQQPGTWVELRRSRPSRSATQDTTLEFFPNGRPTVLVDTARGREVDSGTVEVPRVEPFNPDEAPLPDMTHTTASEVGYGQTVAYEDPSWPGRWKHGMAWFPMVEGDGRISMSVRAADGGLDGDYLGPDTPVWVKGKARTGYDRPTPRPRTNKEASNQGDTTAADQTPKAETPRAETPATTPESATPQVPASDSGSSSRAWQASDFQPGDSIHHRSTDGREVAATFIGVNADGTLRLRNPHGREYRDGVPADRVISRMRNGELLTDPEGTPTPGGGAAPQAPAAPAPQADTVTLDPQTVQADMESIGAAVPEQAPAAMKNQDIADELMRLTEQEMSDGLLSGPAKTRMAALEAERDRRAGRKPAAGSKPKATPQDAPGGGLFDAPAKPKTPAPAEDRTVDAFGTPDMFADHEGRAPLAAAPKVKRADQIQPGDRFVDAEGNVIQAAPDGIVRTGSGKVRVTGTDGRQRFYKPGEKLREAIEADGEPGTRTTPPDSTSDAPTPDVAAPDAAPQIPPADASAPRFTSVDELRDRLRSGNLDAPSHPSMDVVGHERAADDPSLELVGNGRLALHHSGGHGHWVISAPGSMEELYGANSAKEARAYADLLANVRDQDGNPFPWDAPNAPELARAFRGPNGETISEVIAHQVYDGATNGTLPNWPKYRVEQARDLLERQRAVAASYDGWRAQQEADGYTVPVDPRDLRVGDDISALDPFSTTVKKHHEPATFRSRVEPQKGYRPHAAQAMPHGAVGPWPFGILGTYTGPGSNGTEISGGEAKPVKFPELHRWDLADNPAAPMVFRRPRPGEEPVGASPAADGTAATLDPKQVQQDLESIGADTPNSPSLIGGRFQFQQPVTDPDGHGWHVVTDNPDGTVTVSRDGTTATFRPDELTPEPDRALRPAPQADTTQAPAEQVPATKNGPDAPPDMPLPKGQRWVHQDDVRPGDVIRRFSNGEDSGAALVRSTAVPHHLQYEEVDSNGRLTSGVHGDWTGTDPWVAVVDKGPERTAANKYIKHYGEHMRTSLARALQSWEERRAEREQAAPEQAQPAGDQVTLDPQQVQQDLQSIDAPPMENAPEASTPEAPAQPGDLSAPEISTPESPVATPSPDAGSSEPLRGSQVEAVSPDMLQIGDLIRAKGISNSGREETPEAYLLEAPKQMTMSRKGKRVQVWRLKVSMSPGGRPKGGQTDWEHDLNVLAGDRVERATGVPSDRPGRMEIVPNSDRPTEYTTVDELRVGDQVSIPASQGARGAWGWNHSGFLLAEPQRTEVDYRGEKRQAWRIAVGGDPNADASDPSYWETLPPGAQVVERVAAEPTVAPDLQGPTDVELEREAQRASRAAQKRRQAVEVPEGWRPATDADLDALQPGDDVRVRFTSKDGPFYDNYQYEKTFADTGNIKIDYGTVGRDQVVAVRNSHDRANQDETSRPQNDNNDHQSDGQADQPNPGEAGTQDDQNQQEQNSNDEESRRRRRRNRPNGTDGLGLPDGPNLPLVGLPLPGSTPPAGGSDGGRGRAGARAAAAGMSPIGESDWARAVAERAYLAGLSTTGGPQQEAVELPSVRALLFRVGETLFGAAGRNDPDAAAFAREQSQNPTLHLSSAGHFVVWSPDDGHSWSITNAASGEYVGYPNVSQIVGTREEADFLARSFEVISANGDTRTMAIQGGVLLPEKAWTMRDAEGVTFADRMRQVRDRFDAERVNARRAGQTGPQTEAPAGVPDLGNTEQVGAESLSAGDLVRVVDGRTVMGRKTTREGYLLEVPKQVTATRNGQKAKAWKLVVGDAPNSDPSQRSNWVTVLPDEQVERSLGTSDTPSGTPSGLPNEAVPGVAGTAASVQSVRDRFTSGDGIPGSDKNKAYVARIGANPTLGVSPGGGVAYWSTDGGQSWQFAHALTGGTIGSRDGSVVHGSQADAAAMAARYEVLTDVNGQPFPWNSPDASAAGRKWRDAQGRKIGEAMQAARDANAPQQDAPAADAAQVAEPSPDMPTLDTPGPELPADLTQVDEGLLEAHLAALTEQIAATNDWGNPELQRVADELDRRSAVARALTDAGITDAAPADDAAAAAEGQAMDAASGLQPTRETRQEYLDRVSAHRAAVRHEYDNEYKPMVLAQVEDYTKGYIAKKASAQKAREARRLQSAEDGRALAEGRPARNVAPGQQLDNVDYMLFQAPQSVFERHASDELKEWIEYHNDNQRPKSFTAYYQDRVEAGRREKAQWQDEQAAANPADSGTGTADAGSDASSMASAGASPDGGRAVDAPAGDAGQGAQDAGTRPHHGLAQGAADGGTAEQLSPRPDEAAPESAPPAAVAEPVAPPEPIGGQPAEWVRAIDLQPGDVTRLDGVDSAGLPLTRAGYVLGAPEEVTVTREGQRIPSLRMVVGETLDGSSGRRGVVVMVSRDAQAARAHAEKSPVDGGLDSGAQLDALEGRLDGVYPTDRDGHGIFPGSLVSGPGGKGGLVSSVTASSVSVRWDGAGRDKDATPTELSVVDGGAARPTGWTGSGQHIEAGQIAVSPDGKPMGVVEAITGDTVTVSTPDGLVQADAATLRVARHDGANVGPEVVDLPQVAAGDLADGDTVLVDDGGRMTPARIVGTPQRNGDQVVVDYEEIATGARGELHADRALQLQRATGADGGSADLQAHDATTQVDDTRVEAAPVAIEPVTGPTVAPELSPAERTRIGDLGLNEGDDPAAAQAAARIAAGEPVTGEQATALAGALQQHAGQDTGEGRVAQRAADQLTDATGGEPAPSGEAKPVPGTAGDLASGDRVAIAEPDGTAQPVQVTDVRPGPGGTQSVTVQDDAGQQSQRVLPAAAQVHHLPDPGTPTQDTIPGMATPSPTPEATPTAPVQVRASDLRVGDVVDAPLKRDGYRMRRSELLRVVAPPRTAGWWTEMTVVDADGVIHELSLHSSRDVSVHERGATGPQSAGTLVGSQAQSVIDAVVESAVGGAQPGSIHALRQSIAERVVPDATRSGERHAAEEAAKALDAAALSAVEREYADQAARLAAKRARDAAVRAVLRTVNDLEPLRGETEQQTADRAISLLRRIPGALDGGRFSREALARPFTPSRPRPERGRTPVAPTARRPAVATSPRRRVHERANRTVGGHVDNAVAAAFELATAMVQRRHFNEQRADQAAREAARRMAAGREAAARAIVDAVAEANPEVSEEQRAGLLTRIMAALGRIAGRVVEWLRAVLSRIAESWNNGGRDRLRRLREQLTRRVSSWPESRQIRDDAAAVLDGPDDALDTAGKVAHWASLLPGAGQFGQVQRRIRRQQRTRVSDLAEGRLPAANDVEQLVPDRSADGGPGAVAMRHLAAVRGAGEAIDADVATRMRATAPELGADPHGAVRSAQQYADAATSRSARLRVLASNGNVDARVELDAARVEARQAREEARRTEAAYTAALRDATMAALADVRPMGPHGDRQLDVQSSAGPDAPSVRDLRQVERYLPADWLAAAGSVSTGGGERGSYSPAGRHITTGGTEATALHALAHHLQHSVPDLAAAEEAFHFVRTSTGQPGARRRTPEVRLSHRFPSGGHHADATARPGGWERLFTGSEPADRRSWEVLPTGLEALFTDQWWYMDDDMRAFLLGMLGTLGRRP